MWRPPELSTFCPSIQRRWDVMVGSVFGIDYRGGFVRRWAWCGAKGNAHECRLSEGCGAYALDYYNLIDFSLQIPSLVLALIAFV